MPRMNPAFIQHTPLLLETLDAYSHMGALPVVVWPPAGTLTYKVMQTRRYANSSPTMSLSIGPTLTQVTWAGMTTGFVTTAFETDATTPFEIRKRRAGHVTPPSDLSRANRIQLASSGILPPNRSSSPPKTSIRFPPRLPIAMVIQADARSTELIFVNAPKLAKTRKGSEDGGPSIRSRLIRQLARQKKANSAAQLLRKVPVSKAARPLNPVVLQNRTSSPEGSKALIPYAAGAAAAPTENQAGTVSEVSVEDSVDDEELFGQLGLPDPLTILSAARADPFSPWHAELGHRGNEVLDYCIRDFWPALRTRSYAEICYRNRFHQGSKLLLYAVLWATSLHLDLNRGSQTEPKESVETLRYLEIALQALQEHLASTTPSNVPDEVIISILYLAVNHQAKARGERDPSPFTPPRTNLHHLDIFGTTTFHSSHWKIVKDLIHGRGGIHAIKMVTLPWLLTMADLLHAVGSLERPAFPLLCPTGKPVIYTPPCRALRVPQVARHFHKNGGFTQLESLNPPIHSSIVEVFLDICEYSQCLDVLEQSEPFSLTHELGDCRDIIHHRFMNLPNSHDANELIIDPAGYHCDEACQLTRSMYLLVRSAALLYITHVTFPLPRALRLRKQLLFELHSHFNLLGGGGYFPQGVPIELFLWPATIAALAAKDEPSRIQWIQLFRRLCQQALISTWDEFHLTMQSFAWVDCACDKEGYALWTDAQLLG